MSSIRRRLSVTFLGLCMVAAGQQASRPAPAPYEPPALPALVSRDTDNLREVIERYESDRGSLVRFHNLAPAPAAQKALRQFYDAWLAALDRLGFDTLGTEARIDYLLFRNELRRQVTALDQERRRLEEVLPVAPFAATILELQEARQRTEPLDPAQAAARLVGIQRQLDNLARPLRSETPAAATNVSRTVARRASRTVEAVRATLKEWFQFYNGYDPAFTWWAAEPYKQLDKSLEGYALLLREKLAGIKNDDQDTILGDPIGRDALLAELAFEFIPYSPEELLAIAEREFAWCAAEMRQASRDLGYGDDWRRALEHVKNLYVPPGRQPALILEQAEEAIRYVQQHDLVTVPPLARDTWRMNMMTPERQRINPFFTGGEVISVSFPTDGMSHEQKLMSMRGNNIHFSRATVFHELIPGHHLQQFMTRRHRPYRALFRTPFWTEGWSLHWEMLFWDLGFPKTPENRIGMLFWRMHRAARIIFSLSFHLGKMTAGECVDFLVERVGHERENAAAEVRRSFETDYEPLYQCAYMLGALQFRALHRELVGSGRLTNRAFHDTILELGSIPVEMIRASLSGERLARDFSSRWRFYGDLPGTR